LNNHISHKFVGWMIHVIRPQMSRLTRAPRRDPQGIPRKVNLQYMKRFSTQFSVKPLPLPEARGCNNGPSSGRSPVILFSNPKMLPTYVEIMSFRILA
jgi:hypothetical protein